MIDEEKLHNLTFKTVYEKMHLNSCRFCENFIEATAMCRIYAIRFFNCPSFKLNKNIDCDKINCIDCYLYKLELCKGR